MENESKKEYDRAYNQRPDVKERKKVLNQTPEYREKRKAYKQTPEGKESNRVYQQKTEQKEKQRQWEKNRRVRALDMLGSKCAVCGNEDHRVLQIDHIIELNGKKRIPHTSLHASIIAGNTDNLQLLCANCHAIKTWHT
jgi:5-methylcytosine-specific restriction endonuclease McrA